MFDDLKIPIDKFLYEKVNSLGLLFYIIILIPFIYIFVFIMQSNNPSDFYSPFTVFLSVTVLFIQMNYNIYDSKLKKEEELSIRTMEVLNKSYMNINNFTKEEQVLLERLIDCEDYGLNKLVIEQDITAELRNKIIKQYNLLEYLSSLISQKLISKKVYMILMHREIKYWINRSQLLTYIGDEKPEYFITFCIDEKIIDKAYIDF